MLKFIEINNNFKNMDELEVLSKDAFPPEEYLSPNKIIKMAQNDKDIKFLALYNKDNFIGYTVIKLYKTIAYLFFLAINPKYRSKGYGSEAIKLIKNEYKNYQHVVDFEMLDKYAPNIKQREKRREFYLKNGYKPTGQFLSYLGVSYEVFCSDDNFDFEIFKEMLKTLKIKGFKPEFFN